MREGVEHVFVFAAGGADRELVAVARGTAIDPKTNHPLNIPATRRLDEPFNNMEGRSDLYRLEVDHDLNDDWKAHLGYSWNRETYDASQVRTVSVNSNGTLTRSMDGTRGALTTDRFATMSLEGSVNVGGMQHDLVFGLDDEYRRRHDAGDEAERTVPFLIQGSP